MYIEQIITHYVYSTFCASCIQRIPIRENFEAKISGLFASIILLLCGLPIYNRLHRLRAGSWWTFHRFKLSRTDCKVLTGQERLLGKKYWKALKAIPLEGHREYVDARWPLGLRSHEFRATRSHIINVNGGINVLPPFKSFRAILVMMQTFRRNS